MIRKIIIPSLLVSALALVPLTASADSNDYYQSNKKSYGLTNTQSLKNVSKDIINNDYRDGSNNVNVGVQGGSLVLDNKTNPHMVLEDQDLKSAKFRVLQEGSLTIRDHRFTGEGWSLYLEALPLTMVAKDGYEYKKGLHVAESGKILYSGSANITSLTSSNYDYSKGLLSIAGEMNANGDIEYGDKSGTTASALPTSVGYPSPVAIDGNKIRIAYAYKGEGMGDWEIHNALNNVSIIVDDSLKQDKKAYPNGPTPYQTKFEWTLVSGPGNK